MDIRAGQRWRRKKDGNVVRVVSLPSGGLSFLLVRNETKNNRQFEVTAAGLRTKYEPIEE